MARNNPSNPYTRDPAHTAKDVPLPVQKAKVMAAGDHPEDDAFHTVKIRVYGDQAPYIAPVLTPVPGSVWIPEEGTDVAVIFGDSNKPWVIGSWYALDRVEDGEVDLPDYEEGDLRLGNDTGSHTTVHNDGHITIQTGGFERIDIDTQSAAVYMGTDQAIPGDSTYHIVQFDSEEDNTAALFDPTAYSYTLMHDGRYEVNATVAIPLPGQNVRYTLGIFVNGSLAKRKSRQSAVNEPLSLDCELNQRLDTEDEIDVRLLHDRGSNSTVEGLQVSNGFNIERKGI